jgi:hypothetical protein
MRSTPLILIAIAGALALAPAAAAKEVSKVEVCGTSGCTSIPRDDLGAFMDGGLPADPPAHAARWYTIRYTISPGKGEDMKPFKFRNAYVPGANLLRERGEGSKFGWSEPSAAFVRAVRPAIREVTAFPAARLRGLDAKLPDVAVTETVPAPADPPAATGDSTPWGWIVLAGIAGAALLAAVALRVRRGQRRAPRALET